MTDSGRDYALPAQLYGHDAAGADFVHAATARLHHAWLIHGPTGSGKTSFALHAAAYLLSGGSATIGRLNLQQKDCALIAAGAHPDLMFVTQPLDEKTGLAKDGIPVDAIRGLNEFFRKTASLGGWRVAIVRGAEKLNNQAANALLKILEEPPTQAILFLTTAARGRLLPTLRSRCRDLMLSTPDADLFREVLGPELAEPQDLDLLHALAQGSISRARHLARQEAPRIYREFLEVLRTDSGQDHAAIHKFLGAGGKQEHERLDLIQECLNQWLHRLARFLATGTAPEYSADEHTLMLKLARRRRLDEWLEIEAQCRSRAERAQNVNLDRRLVMLENLAALF
jgi:DNA polymerase III subunit delta'